MVHPGVETLLDQFDQAGGHQVIVVHGFGVIADGGRVAHDNEDIAQAEGMGSQQVALDAQQVAAPGGKMQRGLNPHLALDHIADRPGGHAHVRHRAVSHVDHIRAGLLEQGSPGDEFMGGEAARRIHLGGNDKFAFGQLLRQFGGRLSFELKTSEVSKTSEVWRTCIPQPCGFASRALRMAAIWLRGGAAAAADDAGSGFAESQGIIAEVIRVGRVHDAPADLFRPAGVGLDPDLCLRDGCAHRFEQAQQLRRAARAVDTDHVRPGLHQGAGPPFQASRPGRCGRRV